MKSNPEYISQRKPIYLAMENYPNIQIFKLCAIITLTTCEHTACKQRKFHSQTWGLVGYSPWGRKELDMTEVEVSGYSSAAKVIAKQSTASIPSKYADRKLLILKEATKIYYNNISSHTTYQRLYQPCYKIDTVIIFSSGTCT